MLSFITRVFSTDQGSTYESVSYTHLLAIGFGIDEPVTSPTFTIYTIHQGMNRMLAHLDAYRLGSTEEAQDLLLEEFLVSPWCLAVEWPDRVPAWIPRGAWHLDLEIEDDGRHSIRLR